MKFFKQIKINLFIFGLPLLLAVFSCNNDDSSVADQENTNLTNDDNAALLFMLEEEKLARDTYTYLEDLWELNQFSNIKKSEQSHMNAVIGLWTNMIFPIPFWHMGSLITRTFKSFMISLLNTAVKIRQMPWRLVPTSKIWTLWIWPNSLMPRPIMP